jgi:tagatose-bisphosphate aldolase catalytic subunit
MGVLQNTKEMLLKAQRERYAVPAFNIHNLETMRTVVQAAAEMESPVILAATPGTMNFAGRSAIQALAEVMAGEYDIPIALHLDHHETYESILESLKLGTKSVMIDASRKPFEENIRLTGKVVETAHEYGATVEAELGRLVGQEEDLTVGQHEAAYTDPDTVVEFIERTGVDSLAVAIGTAHGLYKAKPKLDFDRLKRIRSLTDTPLVLHGASGLSKEDVRKCIELGCTKVNFSTELKIPFSAGLREYFQEHPEESDPRKYMAYAMEKMKQVVIEKIFICKSNGKA